VVSSPPVPERPAVPSPCIRQCCLDGQDVCVGCGRTLREIIRWHEAGDDERREIFALAEARRRARDRGAG
jgi:predicted Fe-S protein YdhL (DUF1289 family)